MRTEDVIDAAETNEQHRSLLKSRNGLFSAAIKIINHPLVSRFAEKYPEAYKFLYNRFSLKFFWGLPLTFLLVCFAANLLLLNQIVEHLENSPTLLSIDNSVAKFFFTIRVTAIADAFFYFSLIGSLKFVLGIAIIATILFTLKRKFIYIISIAIALLGTGTTVYIGKNYFQRVRPEDYSFYYEPFYSFPSGHATVAVAFYGLLFYSIIRIVDKYNYKFFWTTFAVLFVVLLGFSRLYLGVHYLSDVVAGYSLGLLWLLLAISIIEWKIYDGNNS